MKNELINLITVIGEERDGRGFLKGEEVKKTEVFAEIKSAARSEFYEALRSGRKASIICCVDSDDYAMADEMVNGRKKHASRLEYEGITYRIIRDYKLTGNDVEITCEEVE